MSYLDIAKARILEDEGRRQFPYIDTVGKITIGVGYNLTDRGLPDSIIDGFFADDLTNADEVCRKYIACFNRLTDSRKAALVDMAFDLNHKIGQFHQMIGALNAGDYDTAAKEILDSTFARQTGARALRLAEMMRHG